MFLTPHHPPSRRWTSAKKQVTARDGGGLYATYATSPILRGLISPPAFERLAHRCRQDLARTPCLEQAARQSNDVRLALIFAYGVFGDRKRANRDEPMVWHSLDVAEEVAHKFGSAAVPSIAKTLLHDVREDCGVSDKIIRDLMNTQKPNARHGVFRLHDHIAKGVAQLTHLEKYPKNTPWQHKLEEKTKNKLRRIPQLLPDELAARIADNTHEVRANADDFASGLLRVEGVSIFRVRRGTRASTDEFRAKLEARAKLHKAYIKRLAEFGKIRVGNDLVDCAQVARALDAKFEGAKRDQARYLAPHGAPQSRPQPAKTSMKRTPYRPYLRAPQPSRKGRYFRPSPSAKPDDVVPL